MTMDKIIEVRFYWMETRYNDYDSYNVEQFETVGFFDNIDDAWNTVLYRIEKYHTNYNDYRFNVIILNQKHESIESTYHEESRLNEYNRDIEWKKQCILNIKTDYFKCNQCDVKIRTDNASLEETVKTNHAMKHEKNGNWYHVKFTRILKSEGGENID